MVASALTQNLHLQPPLKHLFILFLILIKMSSNCNNSMESVFAKYIVAAKTVSSHSSCH